MEMTPTEALDYAQQSHSMDVFSRLDLSKLILRGPDTQHSMKVELTDQLDCIFYGTTLHFRGSLTPQPLRDTDGNILLWNGEIFGGLQVSASKNDGNVLLEHLGKCKDEREILGLLASICGPWALMFYQASVKRLWFGRDVFGRRSLLCQRDANASGVVTFASVALSQIQPWVEIPAIGIYAYDISSPCLQFILYPWALPTSSDNVDLNHVTSSGDVLLFNQHLSDVSSVCDIPLVTGSLAPLVHFSQLDQSLPSEITDDQLKLNSRHFIETKDISCADLHKCSSKEQHNLALDLVERLGAAVRTRVVSQAQVCHQCMPDYITHCQHPMSDPHDVCTSSLSCDSGTNSNQKAVGLQDSSALQSQPDQTSLSRPMCNHARVAVLFSGGIDSLVIAALAHRYVEENEPIDLLNVAFAQKPPQLSSGKTKGKNRHSAQHSVSHGDLYNVPDRITGRSGLMQLKTVAPHRKWNFVEIDVPLDELKEKRGSTVSSLVYPLNTVLDDSIGCAIWFAARGQGVLLSEDDRPYTTTARVVLVGMGADEQLVGYSRHRVKFNTFGWSGLVDEMKMEIERISSRNLGRDDRVISDHSREARFPFLDEDVVSFLNNIPAWKKCNLYLPRGIGDKLLLRLAASHLGLIHGATLPKRAIQFGSRIAKAENAKEKASDVCDRLA